MTELEKKAIDVIRNHSHKLIDKFTQEDLENREISIFMAGYHEGNKANEWHYPSKGEYPKDEKKVLCILGDFENDNLEVGYYSQVEGDSKRWRFEDYDLPDDSEEGWGVYAWKEIVLPELKESE